MVDAQRLLADLKRLRKRLEDDLRRHHAASDGRKAVEAEWQDARDTRRTADTSRPSSAPRWTERAVHWILALVFFASSRTTTGSWTTPSSPAVANGWSSPSFGQREHFRAHPTDSDAEYLLATYAEVARLPGLAGLYDPNPQSAVPLARVGRWGSGAV